MDNINDAESMRLLLYLTSVVLALSVIIIGYFMTRRDSAITTATENLTSAVNQLKTIVESLQIQQQIRQPLIDAQLELFRQAFIINERTVKNIDERLIRLETEHEMFHCNYLSSKSNKKE